MLHCSIQLNYTSGRHLCQGVRLFLCIATWTKMGRSLFTRRILVQKAKPSSVSVSPFAGRNHLPATLASTPSTLTVNDPRVASPPCEEAESLLDRIRSSFRRRFCRQSQLFPCRECARLFACGGAEGKVWLGSRQNERSPIRGQLRRTCTGTLQQGQHSRAVTTPRGAQAAECQPCV
jgi:hypothetical protein